MRILDLMIGIRNLGFVLPEADVAEAHVRVGEGVSEDVVRIVSENATALKFDHASFEKD